jgi:hypothetical protein
MMDPLARESQDTSDPILADFFLWGGLCMAFAEGEPGDKELARIASITSEKKLQQATGGGGLDASQCMARYCETIERRHRKISAMEIHRIIDGLLQVAHVDENITEREIEALKQLAAQLGIKPDACDLLISNFLHER